MKKLKLRKTLSLLLCMVMLAGMFPTDAFAVDEAPAGPPAAETPAESAQPQQPAPDTPTAEPEATETQPAACMHAYGEDGKCTLCGDAKPAQPPAEKVKSPAVPRLADSGKITLTLTGFTVEEKEYDGSDKVRLVGASLKGLPAGYECPSSINLTGSLESADVGTHRLVSIDEQYISIVDADGNNAIGQFNIEFDSNIVGTIKPREVTLVGYTAEKTYDGSADVVLDLTNARLEGLPADFTAMLPV